MKDCPDQRACAERCNAFIWPEAISDNQNLLNDFDRRIGMLAD